jgi:hypothetical protein
MTDCYLVYGMTDTAQVRDGGGERRVNALKSVCKQRVLDCNRVCVR